ncbi:MAG: hypothetical protein M3237_19880, partial [Actinomycetota bacterium]|nr:hypothetical protein [Actinomycetota bacterium]
MTALSHPVRTPVETRDGGRFLRSVLRLDAVASGALGVLGLAAAPAMSDLLGPGAGALRAVGAFLVVYAAGLVALAGLRTIPRPAAWTVVVGNLGWAVGTGVLAFAVHDFTTVGTVVVLAQATAVAGFADLQWVGLR